MSNCNPFKVSLKNSYPELANLPRINGVQVVGDLPLQAFGVMADSVLVETTHADLVRMRDTNSLRPGVQYRITDYVATTNGHGIFQAKSLYSANHPFDIIATATSTNSLSEICWAALHNGDEHFANSNLGGWIIWYSLDNDTSKWAWADPVNGKGVIYRMIDEFNNDLPYDFKGFKATYTTKRGEELDGYTFGSNEDYSLSGFVKYNVIRSDFNTSDSIYLMFNFFAQDGYGDFSNNIFRGPITANNYILFATGCTSTSSFADNYIRELRGTFFNANTTEIRASASGTEINGCFFCGRGTFNAFKGITIERGGSLIGCIIAKPLINKTISTTYQNLIIGTIGDIP